MEEKSINFTLYKASLCCVKYVPFIVGIISFITVILGCFGVGIITFALFFQWSLITTISGILFSFTFKCCIGHRLPIYYCGINNVISGIDYRGTIPVNNLQMILIYSMITLLFILLGMYFKNRYNVRRQSKRRNT